MKIFKSLALFALISSLAACGSGNVPVTTFNPYGNGTPSVPGYQTGSTSYAVPGGTKVIIPVLYGSFSTTGKTLPQSAQVRAGDQINVNAGFASVFGVTGGTFPTTNQLTLSQLNVSLNNVLLGSMPQGQYIANQSGVITLSFDTSALIGNGWNYSQYQLNFGNTGVSIGRCTTTAGQPMNCPPGY